MFDVTVISPHSEPYVSNRSNVPGYAPASAEKAKVAKYGLLCEELQIDFHPMAIDVYGSTGFERGLQSIAAYIATKRGTCPISERRKILTQITSLVLQRTAVAISRRRLNMYALGT